MLTAWSESMKHSYAAVSGGNRRPPQITFLGVLVLGAMAGFALPMVILFGGLIVLATGDSFGIW